MTSRARPGAAGVQRSAHPVQPAGGCLPRAAIAFGAVWGQPASHDSYEGLRFVQE